MVRVLAYCHRYGWLAIILAAGRLLDFRIALGAGMMGYAAWTVLGYGLKWRHIYCSFQNAYHRPMTPDRVDWKWIRKSDVYVIAGTCAVMGSLMMGVWLFPEWKGSIRISFGK